MGLFPLSKGDKTIIQIIETNADKIKTQVIVLLKLDNCCKRGKLIKIVIVENKYHLNGVIS